MSKLSSDTVETSRIVSKCTLMYKRETNDVKIIYFGLLTYTVSIFYIGSLSSQKIYFAEMISVKDIVLDIHFYATLEHALESRQFHGYPTDPLGGPII